MMTDALFDTGRREWPGVLLDRAVFDAYVTERAATTGGPPASLCGGELYLACACAHGEARALAEFERHYMCKVPAFLARMSASPRFADDVAQQLRERLFVKGKIRHYSGRGRLTSWLRVVTVRVAVNMLEAEKAGRSIDDDPLPGGVALDPETAVIQSRYGEAFRQALRDALAALPAQDRTLLLLHYVEGLNIGKIAVVFGVSRATIGRRVIDVRERVLEEARRLLGERLGATPEELESLLRVLRSGLAVSVSAILRS